MDGKTISDIVFQIYPGKIVASDVIDQIKIGSPYWKESQSGYVPGDDGGVSLDLQNGIYTIVGVSKNARVIFNREVSVPGSYILKASETVPVTISCRADDNSPIPGAEIFLRPLKTARASLGYTNNDGLLNARVSPGEYNGVLRAIAGKGPHYLILPNRVISPTIDGKPLQINFHVSEIPTGELRFVLPKGTAISIFEVLESAYSREYSEGVEPEIGYDAAYTDFYPIINANIPYTISANIEYRFNMSFAVIFGLGTIYAYEIRNSITVTPGINPVGITEKDIFTIQAQTEPKNYIYSPGDKVFLSYQIKNNKGDRFNRILNYSEARLIFPVVTVWDPNNVPIANNFNKDSFTDFSFDLPLSAVEGNYRADITLDGGIYGKISSSLIFKVMRAVDSSPPQISSLNIPEIHEAGQPLSISANISDDSGIAGRPVFRYSKDNRLSWIEIPMNTEQANIYTLTLIPDIGKLDWQIIAQDTSSNKAEISGVLNIVDTLPPAISHKPHTYAELGTELVIQADIKDYSPINAEIIYSSGSKKINMIKSVNIYTGSIPAMDVKFPEINYYIRASDAFGNTAYMPAWSDNPEFIKLEVKDTLPPVISHMPVNSGVAYMPIVIECIIRDNSGIVNAGLFFKGGNLQNYEYMDMVDSHGVYFAEISSSYVVPGTLEYYLVATDGTRTGRNPESGTYKVQIHSEISSNVISLEISPAATQNKPLEIQAGESFLFKILGRGPSGELLPADVIWTATGGIGNICQDGSFLATGRMTGSGLGKIIATSRNLTEKGTLLQAETWVKITPGPPYRIILNPESITIPAGGKQVFLCNITDRYNNPIEDNGKIIWKLDSKENIGEINNGIFTGLKSGNGRIIVSLGNVQSQSNINVIPGKLEKIIIQPSYKEVPAGSTAIFTATGYDAFSNIIPLGPVWSVRGGVGTVDSSGVFRGGKVGNGEIVAIVGDISGTATVKVITGPLVSVTVSPYTAYLPVSTEKDKSTQQFIAEGWDVAGNPVTLKSVAWSTDALAGTISNTGLFTAVTDPGIRLGEIVTNGSIWATGTSASGVSITNKGTAVIQKNPAGQLTSINVIVQGTSGEASKVYLTTGDVLKFEAVGSDSKGRRISIDPSWSVEGGIGRIDGHGFFTARMPGSGAVIATAGGLTGRISVEITLGALKSIAINPNIMTLSPGSQGYVSAIGYDIYENVVPLRSLQWSIEGDGIVIEPAGDRCLVRAKTQQQNSGYSIISVSSGDIKASANVIIPSSIPQLSALSSQFSPPMDMPYYLEIQPELIDLKIGTQYQFQVRAVDVLGNNREIQNLTWSVIGSIGKISSSGAFQAGDKPSYGRIMVTDGKATGIAIVRITTSDINPGKLMIFPSQLSLVSGALQKFIAFSVMENYLTPVTPAWKVVGNVGKIDSRGLFTATFAGNGEIEGVMGGMSARCQINVSSGLATKIEISPEKLNTKAGNQQNFRVLCRDSSGNLTDSKPSFYLSGDIGTISSSALFSAIKAGSGSVIAYLPSCIGKADIEVIPGDLKEIIISPGDQEVPAGSLTKFMAHGRDAYKNLIPINPIWESDLGNISSYGLFMAGKAGKGQIKAKVGNITGTASIQVRPSSPAYIIVEPSLLSISSKNDNPNRFSAKVMDQLGNVIENIKVTWSITPGLGSIDSQNGVFINEKNLTESRTGYVNATAVINIGTEMEKIIRGRGAVILLPIIKPLNSITITPNPVVIIKGDSQKFIASGKDVDGIEVSFQPAWTVISGDGLLNFPNAISFDGIFKATPEMGVGSSWRVVASATNTEGKIITGEAKISLTSGPLQSIEIICSGNLCAKPIKSGEIIEVESTGYDQFRNKIEISPEWKVNGGIATVNPMSSKNKANVIAGKAGQGEVIAISDGKEGKIPITVEPGDLAEIKISTDPASTDEKAGTSELNPLIIKAGAQLRFIAIGQDSKTDKRGNPKPVNTIQISPVWSLKPLDGVGELGILTSDGRFISRNAGNGIIEAKVGLISSVFYIKIVPGDLKTLRILPASISIVSGSGTQQFSAMGYDAYGNNILDLQDITWKVSGNIGSIDKNGLLTPILLPPGNPSISGTVTASSGNIEGSASVSIISKFGELTAIRISMESNTIQAGGQVIISIIGMDEKGNLLTEFPATALLSLSVPSSLVTASPLPSNPSRWNIQATRILPANMEQRTGVITAMAEIGTKKLTDSVEIKLIPGPLSRISILPDISSIQAGGNQHFRAIGYDAWGNQRDLLSPEWFMPSPTGQIIQDAANPQEIIFIPEKAGKSRLIIRSQNQEGHIDLTILPGEPKVLRVEPQELIIKAGESFAFIATSSDQYGNEIENLRLQWEIEDGKIGFFNNEGIFKAIKMGDSKLKAIYSSGNVVVNSNEVNVKVIPGPMVSADIFIYKDGKALEFPYVLLSGVQYDVRVLGIDELGNEISQIEDVTLDMTGDTGSTISNGLLKALFPGRGKINGKAGNYNFGKDLEIIPHSTTIRAINGGIAKGPFDSYIKIPPGALTSDEIISIGIIPSPGPVEKAQRIGHVYKFSPEGRIFKIPVEISLSYANEYGKEIDEDRLYIYSYDRFSHKWNRIGGTIDKNRRNITININYLSSFAIMQEFQDIADKPLEEKLRILAVNLSPNVYFAPEVNPLNISYRISPVKQQIVNATLEIYDIRGHLVRRLLNKSPKYPGWNNDQWDGTDESGKIVKNGRYFLVIFVETEGDKASITKHLAVFK